MGVHHVSWQSTASGLEDEYIHAAALSWLVGDDDAFHGRPWGDDPASTLDRSLLAGSRGMPVSPVTAS